ncbi:hypothetical protein LCGC14_2706800, partial [marine sediment metagenome]
DDEWSWLVYSGLWEDPLRADIDSFIDPDFVVLPLQS